MARSRQPAGRKRRTREHVIADLSVNHVERAVLLCGYAVERRSQDYGVDLLIDTFDRRGELEPGQLDVQVKATDHLVRTTDGLSVLFRVSVADLKAWLFEVAPVILVVYDARGDTAYWLDVQEYARGLDPDVTLSRRTATLRIPVADVWTPHAIRRLRVMKNELVERLDRRFPNEG